MTDRDYQELNEKVKLIRHFTNLFGYTRTEVRKTIDEIRADNNAPEGEELTDLQAMLLQRADEMERSLEAIEEKIG